MKTFPTESSPSDQIGLYSLSAQVNRAEAKEPAHPSETMPSATSHTRTKSSTKVSSQRRLWPGKCSQVLWWMWTLELWLPQPVGMEEQQRRPEPQRHADPGVQAYLYNPHLSTVQG